MRAHRRCELSALRGRIVDAAVSDPRGAGLCCCGSMLKRCVTCTRTRSLLLSTAASRRRRCRWSHGRGTTRRHAAEIPRPRSRHPDPGGPGYCRRRAGSRSRVCVIATTRTWMTLSGCSRTSLRTATPSSGAPRRHRRGGRSAAGGGDSRELRRAAPGCFEGAKPLRVTTQPGRSPRTPERPDGTFPARDGTRTGAGWAGGPLAATPTPGSPTRLPRPRRPPGQGRAGCLRPTARRG